MNDVDPLIPILVIGVIVGLLVGVSHAWLTKMMYRSRHFVDDWGPADAYYSEVPTVSEMVTVAGMLGISRLTDAWENYTQTQADVFFDMSRRDEQLRNLALDMKAIGWMSEDGSVRDMPIKNALVELAL